MSFIQKFAKYKIMGDAIYSSLNQYGSKNGTSIRIRIKSIEIKCSY
jgi:hypothetical protein